MAVYSPWACGPVIAAVVIVASGNRTAQRSALTPLCAASPAPTGSRPATEGKDVLTMLGDRTVAYIVRDNDGRGSTRGFIVLVRGAPGWTHPSVVPNGMLHGVANSRLSLEEPRDSLPGSGAFELIRGDVHLRGVFNFSLRQVRTAGVVVSLDSGNVLLLDRVDSVGGLPTLTVAGCVAVEPSAGIVDRMLATIPAAQALVH